jgi:hypothetical protein
MGFASRRLPLKENVNVGSEIEISMLLLLAVVAQKVQKGRKGFNAGHCPLILPLT